jgi:hypothetical protein
MVNYAMEIVIKNIPTPLVICCGKVGMIAIYDHTPLEGCSDCPDCGDNMASFYNVITHCSKNYQHAYNLVASDIYCVGCIRTEMENIIASEQTKLYKLWLSGDIGLGRDVCGYLAGNFLIRVFDMVLYKIVADVGVTSPFKRCDLALGV